MPAKLNEQLKSLRKEYNKFTLSEETINKNPFTQFDVWFEEVLKAEIDEPNAMILATSDKNAMPSARTVLLKSYDETGFKFFTHYNSRKGKELMQNPRCALLFFWKEFERQVRIEGLVEKTSRKESIEYFSLRPIESQIAAIASEQSQVIDNKKILIDRYDEIKKIYEKESPVTPVDWGGFNVIPFRFEFWQGGKSRLHDRISFERNGNDWKLSRLSP